MAKLTPDGPSIYPNCGTKTAYDKHLKYKAQPCRPCKDAAAAMLKAWRHRNGVSKSQFVPDEVIKKYGIKVGS